MDEIVSPTSTYIQKDCLFSEASYQHIHDFVSALSLSVFSGNSSRYILNFTISIINLSLF